MSQKAISSSKSGWPHAFDSSDDSDDTNSTEKENSRKSATNQDSTASIRKEPTSLFRLNCRAKLKSATKTRGKQTPKRGEKGPSKTFDLSSSSSDSSLRSLALRLDTKPKAKRMRPSKQHSKPLDFDASSDSNSDSSVEVLETRKTDVSMSKCNNRRGNRKNGRGIDPTITDQSDSDDSIVVPHNNVTIKAATRMKTPSTMLQRRKESTTQRKAEATKVQVRKPPAQPKRKEADDRTSTRPTDYSSSDESSNLRRVALKCAKRRSPSVDLTARSAGMDSTPEVATRDAKCGNSIETKCPSEKHESMSTNNSALQDTTEIGKIKLKVSGEKDTNTACSYGQSETKESIREQEGMNDMRQGLGPVASAGPEAPSQTEPERTNDFVLRDFSSSSSESESDHEGEEMVGRRYDASIPPIIEVNHDISSRAAATAASSEVDEMQLRPSCNGATTSQPRYSYGAKQREALGTEESVFGRKPAQRNSQEVVDLCNDDFDTKMPAREVVVHEGLHKYAPSPNFNRRSRDFTIPARTSTLIDDIEYFSDDCNAVSQVRPRRVTDTTTGSFANMIQPMNAQTPTERRSSSGSVFQQRPSFLRTNVPPEWQAQSAKRQRMRDATNSNPFFARSVRRKGQNVDDTCRSTATILPTNNENVYYRQKHSFGTSSGTYNPHEQQLNYGQGRLRNDLAGGSGVGAGSYSMIDDYDGDHKSNVKGKKGATSTRGRGRTRGKSSRKPKGKGRSRSGWGTKRGRGGGKSRRGRGSGEGTMMESGVDPLLQQVGGADINF